MSHSQSFRSEFIYTRPDLEVSHEAWLIAWGLDWFEHPVWELSISRSTEEEKFRVEISIKTRDNPEELDDWYSTLIMELAMEVDHLDFDYHRIK